ncbi:MAG: ACP S-malonyltransferase [Chloroflexota bacterium]|nr:ACP S-malonyltransferase [Chloroflexota bacterium]
MSEGTPTPESDPVAIVFPGQGSQQPGMGRLVYEHSEAARLVYEEASDLAGMDVARISMEEDAEALSETTLTQPAVLTTSVAFLSAMHEKLTEVGRSIRPRLFGGHSLGLFSAAVAAEALTFRDSMLVVLERSRLMSRFNEGRPVGMASIIGLNGELVQQICEDATLSSESRVDIANLNLDTQTVISGDVSALERAMDRARDLQGRVIRLKVKVSSHTPLHHDQAEEFAQIIREIPMADPVRPIVSNRNSKLLHTADDLREEFSEQLRTPVLWSDNVREMTGQGVRTFIEAGPGHVLARLVRRTDRSVTAVSLNDAEVEPIPISVLPPESTQAAPS